MTKTFSRHDLETFMQAEEIATTLTKDTGKLHIATDAGRHCFPRYDVVPAPVMGEEVSRGFNGDYYPAGVIVSVSKTLKKVTTSDGTEFYRLRSTGSWKASGTWSMVPGHRSEWNPSF